MGHFLKMVVLSFAFIFFCNANSYAQTIRFNLGGTKFPTVSGDLQVSITVDTLTPTVAVGTAADQTFRDDSVGAAFFGYYITAGAVTAGQANGTVGNLKIKAGTAETSGRSYYLLGNGTTVPTLQSNLTDAPAAYTTIASIPRNTTRCGPKYATNGVSGVNGVTCTAGTTLAGMDITQFVKVLFTDLPATVIVSQIDFAIVEE